MRRQVFLSYDNNAPPELVAPENFFDYVQHGFPLKHVPSLQHYLYDFADVFFRTGPLKQTPYVKHDIELTSDEPFRIPPYRYSAEK